jgi:citrate lyase subunit beta/citryl-CoA lyase
VHPTQLPVIAEVFSPSEEERRWAAEVLAAGTNGVSTLASGEMVDPAMVGRARGILARAEGKVAHRT